MTGAVARRAPWAPRCELAESPRWHAGSWWWVDAPAGLVFRSAGASTPTPAKPWLSLGGRTSLVLPAGPAGVLVAHGTALQVYLPSPRGAARIGPLLTELTVPAGHLLNDGIAGPVGGLFVGVVHPDRDPEAGYLQYIRPDGTLGDVARGFGLSNGLALDPAGATLFHADSTQRVVYAHQLDGRGEIVSSAVHLRFDPDDGMPDGLATDAAGGLWVAMYGAGEVRRYAPGGAVDVVVTVPTPQVTSVALGGEDGRDLLITTAREGYDDERSAAEPMAGHLFSARSGYPARPLLAVQIG